MVEYALDVIDDNQDQPEGLQKLLESQVSVSLRMPQQTLAV